MLARRIGSLFGPASVLLMALLAGAGPAPAWVAPHSPTVRETLPVQVGCRSLAARLASVSLEDCAGSDLLASGWSVLGHPILVREYPPRRQRAPRGRVLLFGGIHGDELSSVSVVFKWIEVLDQHHSGMFHWRIVPALNPDGLLRRPASRMNANGVDLNRNFPSPRWRLEAHEHWRLRTKSNPRRYPGPAALSEPESRWLWQEIERFRPDVIVAVHAPLEVLDFDGPPEPPDRLGTLWLQLLGTYPGSLGRYAGVHRGIPVVTIELPHAGIMPSPEEQRQIWADLVGWLRDRLPAADAGVGIAAR